MDKMIQPGYKIILYNGRVFEECTVSYVSKNYIMVKEHPHYEYFFREKDHTLFIEFESGYSYDTTEYSYAIKGDSTELFKEQLRDAIKEQEKKIASMTKELENYKEMLNFIC